MITAISAVRESFEEANRKEEEDRKAQASSRVAMLDDNFRTTVDTRLREILKRDEVYNAVKTCLVVADNPFRSIVRKLSQVYSTPPVRIFLDKDGKKLDEEKEKILRDIYRKAKINRKLKQANVYMHAVNDVILQVLYRDGKEQVDVDVILPHTCSVVQDKESPTDAEAFFLLRGREDSVGRGKNESEYAYWDKQSHYLIDHNGDKKSFDKNPENVNPYGVLPFIILRNQLPAGYFWTTQLGNDIYELTILTSVKRTFNDYHIYKTSTKRHVLATDEKDDVPTDFGVGVGSMPIVPGDTTLLTFDISVEIEKIEQSISELVKSVKENHGLDLSSYSGSYVGSGVALQIKNSELNQVRQEQIAIFEDLEMEMLELICKVYNEHSQGSEIEAMLKLEYIEPEDIEKRTKELSLDVRKLELNLISYIEFYQKWNPSFVGGTEEVLDKLKDNVKVNNSINSLIEQPVDTLFEGLDVDGLKTEENEDDPEESEGE